MEGSFGERILRGVSLEAMSMKAIDVDAIIIESTSLVEQDLQDKANMTTLLARSGRLRTEESREEFQEESH